MGLAVFVGATMRTRRPGILSFLALLAGCDPLATAEGRTALAACFDTCTDRKLSETDQATCRLSCSEAATVPPFPTKPPALASTANCLGTCDVRNDSPNAQACVDACRPQGIAPAVLDRLTTCVADCQGDARSSDDDRATCRLLCAQDAATAP
jgi:hypothetical protein